MFFEEVVWALRPVGPTAIPPGSFPLEWHGRLRSAVSHISPKTGEIWGTPDWLLGKSQTVDVHFALNLP